MVQPRPPSESRTPPATNSSYRDGFRFMNAHVRTFVSLETQTNLGRNPYNSKRIKRRAAHGSSAQPRRPPNVKPHADRVVPPCAAPPTVVTSPLLSPLPQGGSHHVSNTR